MPKEEVKGVAEKNGMSPASSIAEVWNTMFKSVADTAVVQVAFDDELQLMAYFAVAPIAAKEMAWIEAREAMQEALPKVVSLIRVQSDLSESLLHVAKMMPDSDQVLALRNGLRRIHEELQQALVLLREAEAGKEL